MLVAQPPPETTKSEIHHTQRQVELYIMSALERLEWTEVAVTHVDFGILDGREFSLKSTPE